jgi:translation initiation factor 1 (eIF-1/SUI1)
VEVDKKKSGKKAVKKQIVVERATRNKRKCVTSVLGLELFGVKLAEAAKKFGKKFACGASVVKDASNKEQIDVQGDCMARPRVLLRAPRSRPDSSCRIPGRAGRIHNERVQGHHARRYQVLGPGEKVISGDAAEISTLELYTASCISVRNSQRDGLLVVKSRISAATYP